MGRLPDAARSPAVSDIRPARAGRARRLRLFAGGLIAVGLAAAACGGGSASEGAEAGGSSSAPVADGADSGPTTAPAATAAASGAGGEEAGGGGAAAAEGSGADGNGAGPAAVAVSADVPDLEMVDVATGSNVRLVSLVTGDKPLLLWFWAPH